MVLITPKRLFDVSTMKTVMYEDIADDVQQNGYVAISHVWGDQKKYVPKGVGVTGGVTWTIPLSDPEKIARVKDAMSRYEKKYCWFDVLCMPQNRQDEINLEIPFMGDYYAGADIVLVLTTVDIVVSKEFTKWYDMMANIVEEKRDITKKERDWITSDGLDLLDISGERWFERLWTYQEAVMAKKLLLICGDGKHLDLFDIVGKIIEMDRLNVYGYLFPTSGFRLIDMAVCKDNRLDGSLDLVQVMRNCSKRDCFKPQDKFYGALGVLGYKDFPVDYNISMEDLGKAIVKYAYSKGDLSWLSVGGDIGTGFLQPMDNIFPYVGWGWKEDIPGICGVKLGDEIMHMNAFSFAKVVSCEKVVYDNDTDKFKASVYLTFKSWNLGSRDIVKNMADYEAMSNDEIEVGEALLERNAGNKEAYKTAKAKFGRDVFNRILAIPRINMSVADGIKELTVIKATTWKGKDIPLTIYGNADVGDQIMLVRMTDTNDTVLGIVVDKYFRRKGVCICEKVKMTKKEEISRYLPQEFPL